MAQEMEWAEIQEMAEARETVEIWDRNQMTAMEWAKAREMAETWERLRKRVNNYNKEGR